MTEMIPEATGLPARDEYDPINKIRTEAGLQPPPETVREYGTDDLVRAQSAFIQAQIRFLEVRPSDNESYLIDLTQYSRAQNEMIRAQAAMLHQLGVA